MLFKEVVTLKHMEFDTKTVAHGGRRLLGAGTSAPADIGLLVTWPEDHGDTDKLIALTLNQRRGDA